MEELLDELTHFPVAPTDDQMDAMTQALAWLSENPALAKPPARAVCANGGPPVPTDGKGFVRGPGIVCGLNSNYAYAPSGPFIQPRAWVGLAVRRTAVVADGWVELSCGPKPRDIGRFWRPSDPAGRNESERSIHLLSIALGWLD